MTSRESNALPAQNGRRRSYSGSYDVRLLSVSPFLQPSRLACTVVGAVCQEMLVGDMCGIIACGKCNARDEVMGV